MFTNQKDSLSESEKNNPFIQTMQGDFESLAGSASGHNETTTAKNISLNEPQREFASTPSQPSIAATPNINASSPFSKSFSPEISTPQLSPKIPIQNELPPINTPLRNESLGRDIKPEFSSPASSQRKLFLIILFIVITLSLLAGGYFFWLTRSPQTNQAVVEPVQQTPPEPTIEEPVKVNPLSEKYSTENPNFLSIDTNNVTSEVLKKLFLTTSEEISTGGLSKPIEFVVTDTNNNPIALHIFATLAKIDFPPTLLSNLGDTFSLYFYSDGEKIHSGLVIKSKDKAKTLAEMLAIENKLPQYLDSLFLGNNIITPGPAFNTGTYGNFVIRYNNLSPDGSLSIDYTVDENSLFIGTSKNTLRAILDKEVGATTAIPPTPDSSPAVGIQTSAPSKPVVTQKVAPTVVQKAPQKTTSTSPVK